MKKSITLALLLLGTGNFMKAMEDLFSIAPTPKTESGSTFERLPMDEMDRWYAQDAARRYQEYLTNNDKQDTKAERKNFIQVNNQNPDCYEIQNIAQIAQGFTLLRQEEKIAQQISRNKYNPIASSGTVISHILGLEQSAQAKKNSQLPEKTVDVKDEETLSSPSISSHSTPSSDKTTPILLISRKSRAFDNDSPLTQALKDKKKSLFDTLPESSPSEESDNEATNNYDLVDNNSQQTLPKGPITIPLRPIKRKN